MSGIALAALWEEGFAAVKCVTKRARDTAVFLTRMSKMAFDLEDGLPSNAPTQTKSIQTVGGV